MFRDYVVLPLKFQRIVEKENNPAQTISLHYEVVAEHQYNLIQADPLDRNGNNEEGQQ